MEIDETVALVAALLKFDPADLQPVVTDEMGVALLSAEEARQAVKGVASDLIALAGTKLGDVPAVTTFADQLTFFSAGMPRAIFRNCRLPPTLWSATPVPALSCPTSILQWEQKLTDVYADIGHARLSSDIRIEAWGVSFSATGPLAGKASKADNSGSGGSKNWWHLLHAVLIEASKGELSATRTSYKSGGRLWHALSNQPALKDALAKQEKEATARANDKRQPTPSAPSRRSMQDQTVLLWKAIKSAQEPGD